MSCQQSIRGVRKLHKARTQVPVLEPGLLITAMARLRSVLVCSQTPAGIRMATFFNGQDCTDAKQNAKAPGKGHKPSLPLIREANKRSKLVGESKSKAS